MCDPELFESSLNNKRKHLYNNAQRKANNAAETSRDLTILDTKLRTLDARDAPCQKGGKLIPRPPLAPKSEPKLIPHKPVTTDKINKINFKKLGKVGLGIAGAATAAGGGYALYKHNKNKKNK